MNKELRSISDRLKSNVRQLSFSRKILILLLLEGTPVYVLWNSIVLLFIQNQRYAMLLLLSLFLFVTGYILSFLIMGFTIKDLKTIFKNKQP
jgi:hypothetical protein